MHLGSRLFTARTSSNNSHFLSDTNIVNFSVLQKNIRNFLPAFENDPPIVGILFPVPQIMILQLRGILLSIPRNVLELPIVGIIFPVLQIVMSANC